jgi:hypothetical protein
LLVDKSNTRFEDMAHTRCSVNRLLHHDGLQLNQPTALYILSNDGLHVLQNGAWKPQAVYVYSVALSSGTVPSAKTQASIKSSC